MEMKTPTENQTDHFVFHTNQSVVIVIFFVCLYAKPIEKYLEVFSMVLCKFDMFWSNWGLPRKVFKEPFLTAQFRVLVESSHCDYFVT